MDAVIRPARLDDAGRILEIYSHYVTDTAISFEYEVPSLEEFKARMQRTMSKYPYLVAERGGVILGYAYAGAFVGRRAYDWAAELTIYLDRAVKRQGLGRLLYSALEKALGDMGILNLYACIGVPARGEGEDEYISFNSADFHAHLGFKTVGEFYKCGFKFNRWYSMIWMEKIIGEHKASSPEPIPYEYP